MGWTQEFTVYQTDIGSFVLWETTSSFLIQNWPHIRFMEPPSSLSVVFHTFTHLQAHTFCFPHRPGPLDLVCTPRLQSLSQDQPMVNEKLRIRLRGRLSHQVFPSAFSCVRTLALLNDSCSYRWWHLPMVNICINYVMNNTWWCQKGFFFYKIDPTFYFHVRESLSKLVIF